jgi:hypothetical protein
MRAARATPTFLGRAVLAVALALIGLGTLRYGLSGETHLRGWRDLLERAGGPMSFRFVLQPLMASIAAVADGVNDARSGRTPYLWAIITRSNERVTHLNEGLNATARVLLLGVAMDAIYQFRVFGTFYPAEALMVSVALAFIPYLLLRGPVARMVAWWHRLHRSPSSKVQG